MKDEFYIVTEYCEGRDALTYLQKVWREETREDWLKAVVTLCYGVCNAMVYIHSIGYTHRDITISNILVKGGKAKLADLGLARKISNKVINSKFENFVPVFHSIYAPPELKEFPTMYTPSCDVYCFGIAVWEMLMLRKWTRDDTQRPRAEVIEDISEFPHFFENIISRCWHMDDSFRPTFDELLHEFSEYYSEEFSTYRNIDSPTVYSV